MPRMKPRPICPECGSADVAAGQRTSKCNRCGEIFQAERGLAYPMGRTASEQHSSVDDVEGRLRDDDHTWVEIEARRGARR